MALSEEYIENCEVIEEEPSTTSTTSTKISIQELQDEFNKYQTDGFESKSISSEFTLKGLDEINELVANAAIQIDEFVNNGKKEGFLSRTKSKALAILDPKDRWIGKWADNAAKETKKEDLTNKTIDEIVNVVKKNIEQKRDEVSNLVFKVIEAKGQYEERLKFYNNIIERAMVVYNNTDKNTKDFFSAQMLVTMVKGSIINLETTIENDINPLIANSMMSVEKINAVIPNIAYQLKAKLDIKTVQQQLSDLNSMVQVAVDLNNIVGDKVTRSIQDTTLQTLKFIKETGIDAKMLENKIKRDEAFRRELTQTIDSVKKDITTQFETIQNASLALESNRKTGHSVFLESFTPNQRA